MTEFEKKVLGELARLRMVLSDEVIVYVGHFANARKVVWGGRRERGVEGRAGVKSTNETVNEVCGLGGCRLKSNDKKKRMLTGSRQGRTNR